MLTAVLEHDSHSSNICVRNISAGGALISGHAPDCGARVTIQRDNLRTHGRIVRRDHRLSAVQFETAIEPTGAFRLVPRPRKSVPLRSSRSGLKCKALSQSEERFLEISATRAHS